MTSFTSTVAKVSISFFLYYFTVGGNKNVIDLSEIGSALVAVVKNHDKFTKDAKNAIRIYLQKSL